MAKLPASSGRRGGRATLCPRSGPTAEVVVWRWVHPGVGGVAMHAALWREHGCSGSYPAVRRMLSLITANRSPQAMVHLQFAPRAAA